MKPPKSSSLPAGGSSSPSLIVQINTPPHSRPPISSEPSSPSSPTLPESPITPKFTSHQWRDPAIINNSPLFENDDIQHLQPHQSILLRSPKPKKLYSPKLSSSNPTFSEHSTASNDYMGSELLNDTTQTTATTTTLSAVSTIAEQVLPPEICIYPRLLDIAANPLPNSPSLETPPVGGSSTDVKVLGNGYFCKTVLSQPDPISGKVFAVKIPKNTAQRSLISHEAYILSVIYGHERASSPTNFREMGATAASERDSNNHAQADGDSDIGHFLIPGIVAFYGMVWSTLGDQTIPGIAMKVYTQTAQGYLSMCQPSLSPNDPYIGKELWMKWASQLIDGLLFLQSKSIVHCDIKPDNILIDENLNCVLGDFSSAQTLEELEKEEARIKNNNGNDNNSLPNMSSGAFSMQFSAPELLASPRSPEKRAHPSFSTDTFSLGLTLLNFATGNEPYSGAVKHVTQKLMWARKGAALEACSPQEELRFSSIKPLLEIILVERRALADIRGMIPQT